MTEHVAAQESFTLVIQVTGDDIEKGARRDCGKCPVALALTRAWHAIPGFGWVQAELDQLGVWLDQGTWGYEAAPPPEAVTGFMDRFDDYEDVFPFSFTATWTPWFGSEATS
jgi:hypothetical protein